jgi:hypothetical protein
MPRSFKKYLTYVHHTRFFSLEVQMQRSDTRWLGSFLQQSWRYLLQPPILPRVFSNNHGPWQDIAIREDNSVMLIACCLLLDQPLRYDLLNASCPTIFQQRVAHG